MTHANENAPGESAEFRVVVHQNSVKGLSTRRGCVEIGVTHGGLCERQIKSDRGALAAFSFDIQVTTALADEPAHHGKTES